MKKKGFTLIELLAVIVILAIIALIATPIVMNVIKNTKKGAAERSAENYLRAVETAIAEERLDGPIQDGTYEINKDGNLELTGKSSVIIIVNVNGGHTFNGTIEIENGNIIKISNFEVDSVTLIVSGNNIEALDDVYDKYVDVVESEEIADGTYYIQEDGSLCSNANGCSVGTEMSFDLEGTIPTSGIVKIVDGTIVKSESNILVDDYKIAYYNETTGSVQTSTKTCMLLEDLNNDGIGLGDKYVCNPGNGELRIFHVIEDGHTTTLTKNTTEGIYSYSDLIGTTNYDEVSLLMNQHFDGYVAWGNSTDGPITALTKLKKETVEKGWTVQVTLPTYKQFYIANGNKENKYQAWLRNYNSGPYWISTYRPSYGAYLVSVGYMELVNSASSRGMVRPVITVPRTELGQ